MSKVALMGEERLRSGGGSGVCCGVAALVLVRVGGGLLWTSIPDGVGWVLIFLRCGNVVGGGEGFGVWAVCGGVERVRVVGPVPLVCRPRGCRWGDSRARWAGLAARPLRFGCWLPAGLVTLRCSASIAREFRPLGDIRGFGGAVGARGSLADSCPVASGRAGWHQSAGWVPRSSGRRWPVAVASGLLVPRVSRGRAARGTGLAGPVGVTFEGRRSRLPRRGGLRGRLAPRVSRGWAPVRLVPRRWAARELALRVGCGGRRPGWPRRGPRGSPVLRQRPPRATGSAGLARWGAGPVSHAGVGCEGRWPCGGLRRPPGPVWFRRRGP